MRKNFLHKKVIFQNPDVTLKRYVKKIRYKKAVISLPKRIVRKRIVIFFDVT